MQVNELTDQQILALIVGKQEAKTLFSKFGDIATIVTGGYDGMRIKGIAAPIAEKVIAALSLKERANRPQEQAIKGSEDAARILRPYFDGLQVEEFKAMYLNRANRVQEIVSISKGGITGTVADPRIILRKALALCSTGIIIAHNHPSGNLKPSAADDSLTIKIRQGCENFDIKLLDHLIMTDSGFYSYADEGNI